MIATKCSTQNPEGGLDLFVDKNSSNRKTISHALGHTDDIGFYPIVLKCKEPATASKTRLHLVCYQDYPQSTGVHISVDCFNRLVDDFAQLVMFKHEDCPGLAKLSALRASEAGRRRVSVLVGNGGLYLPQELARGADGAMTGFAYPEMLVQVVALYKAGEVDRAEDLFDAYLPMVRYEQQPGFGLAVRKETLYRRGAIACPATRAPGPSLSPTDLNELDRLMTRLETRLG